MGSNDQDAMPAGAYREPEVEEEVTESEPILGKFNSPDELATAYQELEKKMGEQGNELGTQKQMNSMLMEQMQARQAQDQTPATEDEKDDFDYEAQKAELRAKVDEGDLSIEEYTDAVSALSAEYATRNALSQYEQMTAKQQQEQAQDQFLTDHPDFLELQSSGQLEAVKQTLPGMHDDFSAYFALQAEQARAAAQAKEETDDIAAGDERTGKVLNKPGAKAKDIGKPKKGMSSAELKAHTLAKLEAME